MKLTLPTPPGSATNPLVVYLARIVQTIQTAMVPVITDYQATRRIILLSPNGTSYDVTVADDGTLQTTLNPGRSTSAPPPLAGTSGH